MGGSSALARFATLVTSEDFALDHAALLIGAWDTPARDVGAYCARLDELAHGAAPAVARAASAADRASAISGWLFDHLGFEGNTGDYYDPRNSFLADVLDRRTGIPITLSVLYLEVARRLGVLAQGVGFPGHFLVRVAVEDGWQLRDPFGGGRVLAGAELRALLHRTAGADAELTPALCAAATKRQIVSRMLTNLAGIYGRADDLPRSLEVLEWMCAVEPDNSRLERELAALRARVDTLN